MTDATDIPGPPDTSLAPAATAAPPDPIEALTRRMHLLVGGLAALLVGALLLIALLFGRVASAEQNAETARTELAAFASHDGDDIATDQLADDLATIRDDVQRVEAGAALYASQIDGFREQLVALEPQVSAGVDEAITGLREFGDSTISFDVTIDESIPVKTDIVLDRVVKVPIKTTIPINETFDTTIRVSTPLGAIPLDVTVPVDVDVPVDLVVDIPINETVEIDEVFPVQLDVPIAIDVRETELANLTDSLAAGLESLQDVLSGLAS